MYYCPQVMQLLWDPYSLLPFTALKEKCFVSVTPQVPSEVLCVVCLNAHLVVTHVTGTCGISEYRYHVQNMYCSCYLPHKIVCGYINLGLHIFCQFL